MSHITVMSGLIAEAETLGVSKLTWTCDVRDWAKEAIRPGRWTCRATFSAPIPVVYEGLGRTGEEAIRELLAFLRSIT